MKTVTTISRALVIGNYRTSYNVAGM